MVNTVFYEVAGHCFGVTAEEWLLAEMSNYAPFATKGGVAVFSLFVEEGAAVDYVEELRQEDEGQDIICGKAGDSPVFEFRWAGQTAGWLMCEPDYSRGVLRLTGAYCKLAIDNALMVLYALATACRRTVLFHAAVVSYKNRGYMFLGKSGTGKSTHARLWLRYVEGAELVNDDNPVVRLDGEGHAVVYGSPWSGKTPCYRAVSCPLGGLVQLSQAPYNKIGRLDGLAAYAVLVPSISGKRWDRTVADGLHETENLLAQGVPVWHLECLPDEGAAQLCRKTIAVEE